MTQLPVVAAKDLADAEVRQLKEVAAAVEPAADWTPMHQLGVGKYWAKRLHKVMSQLLNGILFDVLDEVLQNAKISITAEMVKEQLADLRQNKKPERFYSLIRRVT